MYKAKVARVYQIASLSATEGWELLALDYRAKQDGYVEVYIANDSETDV